MHSEERRLTATMPQPQRQLPSLYSQMRLHSLAEHVPEVVEAAGFGGEEMAHYRPREVLHRVEGAETTLMAQEAPPAHHHPLPHTLPRPSRRRRSSETLLRPISSSFDG